MSKETQTHSNTLIYYIKYINKHKIHFKVSPTKKEILLHQFLILTLKNFSEIQKNLKNIKINVFCSALLNDKKSSISYYKFILPEKNGNLYISKVGKKNLDIKKISLLIFKNLLKNEI